MIVVDTCVVIWLANDPSILSRAAVDSITAARKSGGVAISGVTLYELAWLANNNRISTSTSLEAFLAEVEAKFIVLPLTAAVARIAVNLPKSYPNDPVDRIIGATALDRRVSLVTKDKAIQRSKAVTVIW